MTFKVEVVKTTNGYAAACPDLPGCASQGATEDEALSNIRRSLDGYYAWKASNPGQRVVRSVEAAPQPASDRQQREMKPFKIKPFRFNLPTEWTSGKVEDLLDLLEGPDRRC